MSSSRKSRWSLKTSQLKDDSAKAVLLISLSSEVLSAINKGCRLGQQGYVLVNVHLKILRGKQVLQEIRWVWSNCSLCKP